jgi:hypothetical protein
VNYDNSVLDDEFTSVPQIDADAIRCKSPDVWYVPTQRLRALKCSVEGYEPFHRISTYSNLQELTVISHTGLSQYHFRKIVSCVGLRKLYIGATYRTDIDQRTNLLTGAQLPLLREIKILNAAITDIHHNSLTELILVKCIICQRQNIDTMNLNLPQLRKLDCSKSPLIVIDMLDGQQMPNLTHLRMGSTGWPQQIVLPHQLINFTNLEFIEANLRDGGDYSFLTKLKHVVITDNVFITAPVDCRVEIQAPRTA